jgi:hypothetical protein
MSVNQKAFSINGTLRSQGYIGQTSLSRSLPRTLMRGGVARGYGGYYGNFPQTPIIQSAVVSLNDPTVIKSSVINTHGMIEKKLECCHFRVKPDSNHNNNDQGSYIDIIAKKTISNADQCDLSYNPLKMKSVNCCPTYTPFFRKVVPTFTKPESYYIPISCGEYLRKINNKCVKENKIPINRPNVPVGCQQTTPVYINENENQIPLRHIVFSVIQA